MDYGGYIVIAILVLAAVFFALALYNYNRGNIKMLKFTSYGFATFFVVGLISYYSSPSEDLKISLFVILGLSLVFLWFYRGSARDEKKK